MAHGGKGQGKGKGSREGRIGQEGRGRAEGGERPTGSIAYGRKGSKGRAANGDRPVGAAICRREQHPMASCHPPPPVDPGAAPPPPPSLSVLSSPPPFDTWLTDALDYDAAEKQAAAQCLTTTPGSVALGMWGYASYPYVKITPSFSGLLAMVLPFNFLCGYDPVFEYKKPDPAAGSKPLTWSGTWGPHCGAPGGSAITLNSKGLLPVPGGDAPSMCLRSCTGPQADHRTGEVWVSIFFGGVNREPKNLGRSGKGLNSQDHSLLMKSHYEPKAPTFF